MAPAAPSHVSPLPVPRDLTIPEAGSTTAREVLSRAIRRLLGELRALPRTLAAHPMAQREAITLAPSIDRVLGTHPGAVASALRRPTTAALLRCLRREVPPPPAGDATRARALVRELAASLFAELAAGGALPGPIDLAHPPARILVPVAGVAIDLPAGTDTATFTPGALTVTTRGVRTDYDLRALARGASAPGVSRIYHPVTDGIALALGDNNPLAMVEAHPDKEGNAVDLGGHAPDEWVAVLRRALDLVARHLPDLRAEMDLYVHQFVPVGYDPERHLSASYQEALGTVYLTLHPDLMTMTEAVIHEFSHTKVNALFELDPVLENAFWPLYASPVRPDPRPLHGVLLAVHAFLPVARLYEQMLAAGAPEALRGGFTSRYTRIRQINHEGAEVVLSHGRPTPVGRGLLDEIRRWDTHFAV